ncbi:MAG: DUF2834 domain-containing protein [Planctomycetota bacterium]|nr:DUF2834 domain-containing protein [Planctomycetota bacterium]
MKPLNLLIGAVLFTFVDFTAYALYHHGYIGFWQEAFSSFATSQVTIDLFIALSIVMVWMFKDAKSRNINPAPFVILTLALGSIGPLSYLVRRGFAAEDKPESVEASAPMLAKV